MRGNSPADPAETARYGVDSATSSDRSRQPGWKRSAVASKTAVIGAKTSPLGAPASAMSRLRHGVATSTRIDVAAHAQGRRHVETERRRPRHAAVDAVDDHAGDVAHDPEVHETSVGLELPLGQRELER